jgi:hypothetical protein
MDDNPGGYQIKLAPPSPKLMTDGVSQWLRWQVDMPRDISSSEITELTDSLSRPGISTFFRTQSNRRLEVEVMQSPIGDYTELYDASLRAIFRLEKRVGALIAIEGRPRPDWNIQFVFANRFGALD